MQFISLSLNPDYPFGASWRSLPLMPRAWTALRLCRLLALASTVGCAAAPADALLVDSLAAIADTARGVRVDAARILTGSWDTMWVIGPYYASFPLFSTNPAIRVANRTRVSVDEHAHVVVLMAGRQVVRAAEVPRSRVDFDLGNRSIVQLPRRLAHFTVCRDTLGNRQVLAVNPALARPWIVCPPGIG